MQEVFLSYAHEDRERVAPLVAALEQLGWQVWWDRRILAGQTWDEAIREALDTARCVVVIWTERSVHSEWVRIEANQGQERHILVPVLLDAVRIPLAFQLVQAAELTGWDGSAGHAGFRVLEAGIRAMLSRNGAAAEPAGRPRVPDVEPTEPRALDAAIGRELMLDKPANLITMIRLADSPGLRKILAEDDETDLSPDDVASRPFDLTFQTDPATGRLEPAQLIVKIHAPAFEPPTQQKKVRISPGRDSAVFDFLLTPVVAGDLVVHVEAYEGEVCLVSRVLRPVGVAEPVTATARLVVSMPLAVKVKAAAAAAVPGEAEETTERYTSPPVFANPRVGIWKPPKMRRPSPGPVPVPPPAPAPVEARENTAAPPVHPRPMPAVALQSRRDPALPEPATATRRGGSMPWMKWGITAAILVLSGPAIWYSLHRVGPVDPVPAKDPYGKSDPVKPPSDQNPPVEGTGKLVKVRVVLRPAGAEVLVNGEVCGRPCETEVPAGTVEIRASAEDADPLVGEAVVPGPGYAIIVDLREGKITVTR